MLNWASMCIRVLPCKIYRLSYALTCTTSRQQLWRYSRWLWIKSSLRQKLRSSPSIEPRTSIIDKRLQRHQRQSFGNIKTSGQLGWWQLIACKVDKMRANSCMFEPDWVWFLLTHIVIWSLAQFVEVVLVLGRIPSNWSGDFSSCRCVFYCCWRWSSLKTTIGLQGSRSGKWTGPEKQGPRSGGTWSRPESTTRDTQLL